MTQKIEKHRRLEVREANLEAHLRNRVRTQLGGMIVKIAPTTRGLPDRMVLLPGGRVVFIELKALNGQLSAIQRHKHAMMRELGTPVCVLEGREEIDDWVKRTINEEFGRPTRSRRARAAAPGKAEAVSGRGK